MKTQNLLFESSYEDTKSYLSYEGTVQFSLQSQVENASLS